MYRCIDELPRRLFYKKGYNPIVIDCVEIENDEKINQEYD